MYTEVRNPRIVDAGHVEYEVCMLVKEGEGLTQRECKWSVWRRFREFEAFDKEMRAMYGWQAQHIKLPPKKTFGAKSPEFVEKRRGQLQEYMRAVMAIKGATDFASHFGCRALATFINWEGRGAGMRQEGGTGAAPSAGAAGGAGAGAAAPAPAPAARPRRTRRASRRTPRANTQGIPSDSAVRTGVASAPKLATIASDLPVGGSGAARSGSGSGGAAPAAGAGAPAPAPAPAPAAPRTRARARAPAPAPASSPAPAATPAPAPAPKVAAALPPPQPGRAGLLADIRKLRKG